MNNASATPAIIKGAYGFDGEIVIVTGAARGIGEGIAGVLAQAGAMVADSVHLDIADEDSIVFAHAAVVAKHGAPWALVNNAGIKPSAAESR